MVSHQVPARGYCCDYPLVPYYFPILYPFWFFTVRVPSILMYLSFIVYYPMRKAKNYPFVGRGSTIRVQCAFARSGHHRHRLPPPPSSVRAVPPIPIKPSTSRSQRKVSLSSLACSSLAVSCHSSGAMSISHIGRNINALKLAQRAASPWLASARAAPVAASHIRIATPQPQFGTVSHGNSNNLRTSLPTNALRHFSSVEERKANDADGDDDGGPVARVKKMTNAELADLSTVPGWDLVHNPPRRNPRGALVGTVVSDKMQKTVNVAVDRYKIIPIYRKRWKFTRKFMAHDEHEVCNVGDLVMIVPCQKISRHKHFMVREIIRPKGQL